MSTSTTDAADRDAPPPREIAHLSVAERTARGRAARNEVPRRRQAEFAPGPERPDPIALLESQAESRVPELVPIRYGRMLASPFAFYRGAALIMASDLATTPVAGLRVQLCGDAHLSNFGIFGTPERRMLFDINDFDETLPGPFEWDVKRLAASLEVAARENGYTPADRQAIVLASARRYRTAMTEFGVQTKLEVFYASLDIDSAIAEFQGTVPAKMLKRAQATVAKARTRDSMQAFNKLTHVVDGEPHIISDPPLIVPVAELYPTEVAGEFTDWVQRYLREYRSTLDTDRRRLLERYRFVEIARKVVGVGSVGTRAWIALMFARDAADPLFLQMKEAQTSVLEDLLRPQPICQSRPPRGCGATTHAGRQRRLSRLGTRHRHRRHRTRLLHPSAARLERLGRDRDHGAQRDGDLRQLVRLDPRPCACPLGRRIAIAAYLGKSDTFDRAIAAFAAAYADQNERDYKALRTAVASGRITAEEGV